MISFFLEGDLNLMFLFYLERIFLLFRGAVKVFRVFMCGVIEDFKLLPK